MTLTINKALVLLKTIRERTNDLKGLRTEASVSKRTWLGDTSRDEKTPLYDVKELDKKILELQKISYSLETEIKTSNNVTYITVPEAIEDVLFTSLG